jgi:hypothetical protein
VRDAVRDRATPANETTPAEEELDQGVFIVLLSCL